MLVLILLASFATISFADGTTELSAYHQKLMKKFDEVRHIDADQLTMMTNQDILLFDVREADEFEVSHIDGAVRVSPDISRRDFIKQFASQVSGKTVVFYCSVGYRSSALAEDIQDSLIQKGSQQVFNLTGGIFNWHNQQRSLVNRSGDSDHIHPNAKSWTYLLDRPEQARYQAEH